MLISTIVRVQLGEVTIQGEAQVPSQPVDLQTMLPAFRAIADGLVNIAIGATAKQNRPISCRKSCAACCRMAVPVSEPEAYRLRAVVEAMPEPRRSTIRARFASGMDFFRDTGVLEDMFQRVRGDEAARKAIAGINAYHARGVACPFLEDESCTIYEERPLACREFLVTSPAENCASIEGDGVQRLPVLARPGDALILIASNPNETRVAVLPMIQILEWTEENPDHGARHGGPEWMGLFAEMLQTKANNTIENGLGGD